MPQYITVEDTPRIDKYINKELSQMSCVKKFAYDSVYRTKQILTTNIVTPHLSSRYTINLNAMNVAHGGVPAT